jgi:hypothetical protein
MIIESLTNETEFAVEVRRATELWHYWKRTKHVFDSEADAEWMASYLRCVKGEKTRVVKIQIKESEV